MNNNNQIKVGEKYKIKSTDGGHGFRLNQVVKVVEESRGKGLFECVPTGLYSRSRCVRDDQLAPIELKVSPIKKKEPKKKYQKVEFYTDNPREAIKRLYGKIEDEFSFPGKFGEIKVHDRALSKEGVEKEFAPKKEKIQKLSLSWDSHTGEQVYELRDKLNELIEAWNKEKDH